MVRHAQMVLGAELAITSHARTTTSLLNPLSKRMLHINAMQCSLILKPTNTCFDGFKLGQRFFRQRRWAMSHHLRIQHSSYYRTHHSQPLHLPTSRNLLKTSGLPAWRSRQTILGLTAKGPVRPTVRRVSTRSRRCGSC